MPRPLKTYEIKGYLEVYQAFVSYFFEKQLISGDGQAYVQGDPCPEFEINGARTVTVHLPHGSLHLAIKHKGALLSGEMKSFTLSNMDLEPFLTGEPITISHTAIGDIKLDFKDRDVRPNFEIVDEAVVITWPDHNGPNLDLPLWPADPQIDRVIVNKVTE